MKKSIISWKIHKFKFISFAVFCGGRFHSHLRIIKFSFWFMFLCRLQNIHMKLNLNFPIPFETISNMNIQKSQRIVSSPKL